MKTTLPENAKIAKEAKECMQECAGEFISFITSEGETFLVTKKFIYLFFISPTSSYIKWFYCLHKIEHDRLLATRSTTSLSLNLPQGN